MHKPTIVRDDDVIAVAVAREVARLEAERTASQAQVVTKAKTLWWVAGALVATLSGITAGVRAWDQKVNRDEVHTRDQIEVLYQKGSPRLAEAEQRILDKLRAVELKAESDRAAIITGIEIVGLKLDAMSPRARQVRRKPKVQMQNPP